jgi:hypothetical protein
MSIKTWASRLATKYTLKYKRQMPVVGYNHPAIQQ